MKQRLTWIMVVLTAAFSSMAPRLLAQNAPFAIDLEPVTIPQLGGLQAFAFGQHGGKWVVFGGRLDGLHRRQPWAAFDIGGHNTQVIVVDPVAGQRWTAALSSLPTAMQEQLSSTNMEFQQVGEYLYIVGGYGYSATLGDHKTYDNLTAVHLPGLIQSVTSGGAIGSHFRQVSHPDFAVTGGHLKTVNGVFFLVGGNKFDGRYNPMGNPTYTQIYTEQIRKFTIADNGFQLNITHLPSVTDATNLHRRDYNVVPQIMPTGNEGLTAFSGVFQLNVDLPYLNCVNIDSNSHAVNSAFSQYYNHYHCPVIPLYSASMNEMHSVFFGGIAQYYDSAGTLVRDDNVPFVKTIARVTRNAAGIMTEYKLPVEMPDFLGASAEFIPLESLPTYPNEVIQLDSLPQGRTHIGYIYGGIASPDPNIFWTNDGTQSHASAMIFKVYLNTNAVGVDDAINLHSNEALDFSLRPNPTHGKFSIGFALSEEGAVTMEIYDHRGRLVEQELRTYGKGEQSWEVGRLEEARSGVYYIKLKVDNRMVTQKLVVLE
ncbi:MAG: T9SS type A sorting domain-containing protein [Bacteroidia bacterium]